MMQLNLDEILHHVVKCALAVLLMDGAEANTTSTLEVYANIKQIFASFRSPELNR